MQICDEGIEVGTQQFDEPESDTNWTQTDGYAQDSRVPLHPPIDAGVRAPLDYDYSGSDTMAALPRSDAIDAGALPADLQRKARAHGDDLDNIVESEQLTTRPPAATSCGLRSPALHTSSSRSPSTAHWQPRAWRPS